MQTFTEVIFSFPYFEFEASSYISWDEFEEDLRRDFYYMEIVSVDEGEGDIDGPGDWLITLKPIKEMDLSDIFHFGFMIYRYDATIIDYNTSMWIKQKFTEFKLNLDSNLAIVFIEEYTRYDYEGSHTRDWSPTPLFNCIKKYSIERNLIFSGHVLIKFETSKAFEIDDIYTLGRIVSVLSFY
jgi:hypothetical protein